MSDKRIYLFLTAMIAGLYFSCSKKDSPAAPSPPPTPPPTVTPPPPPTPPAASAGGQLAGFFLNDWQARTFSAPLYTDTAKPSGTVTSTVYVYPATVITNVSKYLFGNNSNPYMTQMVTEPGLMASIGNLSPNVIRFPGGSISDVYFWNTPTQPADVPDSLYDTNGNPVPAFYWNGQNTAGWTLSLDNYYSMLQQTGSTGMITVNYAYARYGTSSDPVAAAAHLAADWVRYDKGRTKFWEIGNEDGGPWEASFRINTAKNQDGQPQIISGALYGKHFTVFADSMRKAATEVGSTINIGVQVIPSDASNSWNPPDRTWNTGLFSNVGNAADYFIVHDYFATSNNQNATADQILALPAGETRSDMQFMLQSVKGYGVDMKPIALTEWNTSATGMDQMVSNISGLHAAMVVGEAMKNQFGAACRWDLANGWGNGDDQGMFSNGDEPGVPKWNARPSFYYLYYFQKFFGDRIVASALQGDTTDLLSYASLYSSGEAGIVLVNKGGTRLQTVKINISTFTPGNRYYWYTLQGGSDGDFSRKVLINGNGPSLVAGGPDNYTSIAAHSASAQGDILVSVPARGAVFIVVDKK
jgi:hypothetical protein